MTQTIKLVEVHDDLTVTVRLPNGKQERIALLGLQPQSVSGHEPASAGKAQLHLRRALGESLGARMVTEDDARDASQRRFAYLEYLAWQDRSDSVWVDVGRELVSMEYVTVDGARRFGRKSAYLATQTQVEQGQSPRYPYE